MRIDRDRTLVVVPTYQCNASCDNCGTFSSPKNRDHAGIERIQRAIEQAVDLGIRTVVFTGGEPSLKPKLLEQSIRIAKNLGMGTRLVSNGQWGESAPKAESFISVLISAGLDELNLSIGDEHAKFIKPQCVITAAVISIKFGLRVCVMVEQTRATQFSGASVSEMVSAGCADPKAFDDLYSYVESPWMPLRPDRIGEYSEHSYINRSNMHFDGACSSVLQTYVLQPNGRFLSCCGFGVRGNKKFIHGSIESGLSRTIRNSETSTFLRALNTLGPAKILEVLSSFSQDLDWENKYAHKCQACANIFRNKKLYQLFQDHEQYFQKIVNDAESIREEALISFGEMSSVARAIQER